MFNFYVLIVVQFILLSWIRTRSYSIYTNALYRR